MIQDLNFFYMLCAKIKILQCDIQTFCHYRAQPGCLGRLVDFQEEYVGPIELGQRHDANKRELAEARKSEMLNFYFS